MSMSQLWPPAEPRFLRRQVWDSQTARSLPGMARALQLYGLIASCELQRVRGVEVLATPRILERPDPDIARLTFVGAALDDWWLNGNAAHLVTARGADGYPAAGRYYPAHRWGIWEDPRTGQPIYHLDGRPVARENVVHVQRGVDPMCPWRGVGVVEQHCNTLNRAGLQEAAETSSLTDRGMPAVAVIKPNAEPDPVADDAVAQKWVERFRGPEPKPGIFPAGTSIVPLSWNPSDGQMVEARKLTKGDIASLMNLDGYWLGVEGSSHTYKSPGPLFLMLLKTSFEPVMDVFEDVWSTAWFPRGTGVRFERTALLRDDLGSMLQAFATGKHLFPDPNEPRLYMGFPELDEEAFKAAAPPVPPAPEPEPDPDPAPEPAADPDDDAEEEEDQP